MKSILTELFNKYNINYTEVQLDKLCKLYQIVVDYNQKINLTSITDIHDFALLHILDSVICIKNFKKVKEVIDIGTGAGFPAFPLAILLPDVKFTLVDSVNKKTSFHNIVINELALNNVVSVNSRIEDFAKNNFEKYDMVTARAVAKLPTLLEYSLPLLKLEGNFLAYKTQQQDQEILESKKALDVLGGEIKEVLEYEFEGLKRSLILVKKVKNTPKKYPREQNKPRLKPL